MAPAHAWPDRRIAALAARQGANIGRAQLRELGIPAGSIAAAARRGRLHPVHRGVYSLVPPAARPRLAAEHAALLACGPGAALSHHTAAALHGLRVRAPASGDVQVTVFGGDRGRRRAGLSVHRSGRALPGEVVRIGGLAVTSIARTVVDLAPELGDRALEHLVDEALTRTSRARLAAAGRRRVGRPGVARVGECLDPERPSSDTWSRQEERLLRAIRAAGLPSPEVNVAIGAYVPDLLWREQLLIVEYDSDAHHAGPAAMHRGWRRHNELAARGFQVIHVTAPDLRLRLPKVIVWITAGLIHGGWSP